MRIMNQHTQHQQSVRKGKKTEDEGHQRNLTNKYLLLPSLQKETKTKETKWKGEWATHTTNTGRKREKSCERGGFALPSFLIQPGFPTTHTPWTPPHHTYNTQYALSYCACDTQTPWFWRCKQAFFALNGMRPALAAHVFCFGASLPKSRVKCPTDRGLMQSDEPPNQCMRGLC